MVSLMSLSLLILLTSSCLTETFSFNETTKTIHAIKKRALQKSHEKPRAEKWMDAFFGQYKQFNQVPSLVNLVTMISQVHLGGCTPVVLYDSTVETSNELLLEELFRNYPLAYMHGTIDKKYSVVNRQLLNSFENKCVSYILLMEDVMRCKDVIGAQNANKVIVVARSSQWRVYEFLANEAAQSFVNLLVVAQSEKIVSLQEELPFILYTHNLYVDGLGSSTPHVLTSWIKGNLTRPSVPLFPDKIKEGFAGHRFIISAANQPPFAIRRNRDENDDLKWEGIEVRLVKLLAEIYNFTTDFREARNTEIFGSGDAVMFDLMGKKADIGLGGLYIVPERIGRVDVSYGHSQDCAAFVSLTSTALPRWRAIMGPFQWTVWLFLTLVYLFAIFPLAFSDRHSLRYLIETPEEMENMFWYVFGTFTNCFSFTGKRSWSKTEKVATRLLIGFYWIFTIIITACYTGSIIAFVTLPVFPEMIDSVKQLVSGRYQIGTLDKGGWQYWFENSTDPTAIKLLKNIEYVSSIEAGIKNTTTAFFWSYAFLGSRAQLDYVVRTNYSTSSKRSLLHISSECFVPYGVGMVFQMNSVYKSILNQGIMRAVQSGFLIKFKNDVEWEMMRSAAGKLLQANGGSAKALSAEDRALALDDTQGMFLLLSFGFLLGGVSLLSEWLGGCFHLCKRKRRKSTLSIRSSISSNPRSYNVPTPREKLDSIQYSRSSGMFGSFEDKTINEQNENDNDSRYEMKGEVTENDVTSKANHVEFQEDIEVEINEIFNLSEIFGEENYDSHSSSFDEELRDEVKSDKSH